MGKKAKIFFFGTTRELENDEWSVATPDLKFFRHRNLTGFEMKLPGNPTHGRRAISGNFGIPSYLRPMICHVCIVDHRLAMASCSVVHQSTPHQNGGFGAECGWARPAWTC